MTGVGGSELGIGGFEDLKAWQEAQNLAVEVYTISKLFPKDELFGITSQVRRAVSSVSANIAEGYGRSTANDKLHFMSIAYGSLLETRNFIYLSHKLDFITREDMDRILLQITTCQKLLNGFKRSLKS